MCLAIDTRNLLVSMVSHTACYAGALLCGVPIYLHGSHTQHTVLGPYIQYSVCVCMGLMHSMLCWGLRLSIVWGPHIYVHGSHTHHAMLGPCCVGSPYLHGVHAQHAMLGPYIQYSVGSPYLHGSHEQHTMLGA